MNIIVYFKYVICVLFFSFCVVYGSANKNEELWREQGGLPDVWTLELAIDRALAVNADVVLARYELEYQTGVHYQVRSNVLPQVNLSSRVSFRGQSTIDRSPSGFDISPSDRTAIAQKSYSVGVEFRQLLFDGFSSFYKVHHQNLSKQASFWKLKNTSYRVVSLVRQAYDAILYDQSIVLINKESVKAFEELYRMESQKEMLGEGTELGALQVQAKFKNSQAIVAESEANLVRSEEKFRQLLQLEFKPGERRHYRLKGRLVQKKNELTYDQAMKKVGNSHPDIVSAKLERAAAQASLKSSQLSYFPQIEGVVQYDVKSSYYDVNRNLNGWTIGFQGRLPLFDGSRRAGSIKSARAGLNSSEVKLKQKRIQLSSKVRELYDQIDSLLIGVESKEESVGLGVKVLSESERLYQEGQIAIKEVIEEELSLRDSQRDLQRIVLELNSLIYQLEYILVLDDSVGSSNGSV